MISRSQVIILCEDLNHYHFARALLIEYGVKPRKIVQVLNQGAQGSGEGFVRERLPLEVKAFRSRASKVALTLFVITDADNKSVEERKRQLDSELRGQTHPRGEGEKILYIIPRRNIETWFYYLDNDAADEEANYKNHYRNAKPSHHGRQLAKRCKEGALDNPPPSLSIACEEWRRVSAIGGR